MPQITFVLAKAGCEYFFHLLHRTMAGNAHHVSATAEPAPATAQVANASTAWKILVEWNVIFAVQGFTAILTLGAATVRLDCLVLCSSTCYYGIFRCTIRRESDESIPFLSFLSFWNLFNTGKHKSQITSFSPRALVKLFNFSMRLYFGWCNGWVRPKHWTVYLQGKCGGKWLWSMRAQHV